MLPFSKPPYVKASKRAILRAYVIEAVGLASDQVLGVIIDDKVALEQVHPTYSLAILPLTDDTKITYEDALFYADCFAYEHEIPTIALPHKRSFGTIGVQFLLDKRPTKDTRATYFRELTVALENINAIRFGPAGYVEFRHPAKYSRKQSNLLVHLDYSQKYKPVAKEVHLYSLALRQIDPLSEYLGYYRVIESISGSNGLSWLKKNLKRVWSARFGLLPAGSEGDTRRHRINLFTVMRRRAISHLRDLLSTMSYAEIAHRLYQTNRCGIAHGQSIRRLDFSTDFKEVYADGFIIKLMARMAIQDKCGRI